MIKALARGFFEIVSPSFLRIVLGAFVITFFLCIFLYFGFIYGLDWIKVNLIAQNITLPGWVPDWLRGSVGVLRYIVAGFGVFMLLPIIAFTVTSFFLDQVVHVVERRHYQDDYGMNNVGLWGNIVIGLSSSFKIIFYNILAIPLYILLFMTTAGVGALILYYAINGLVLGSDILLLVLLHHHKPPVARKHLSLHKMEYMTLGAAVMFLFTIPPISVISLLIGVAAAVHYAHDRGLTR